MKKHCGHSTTIWRKMSNAHYWVLLTSRVRVRVRVRFSVWFVDGYAHVFVLLSVAIVTLFSEVVRR